MCQHASDGRTASSCFVAGRLRPAPGCAQLPVSVIDLFADQLDIEITIGSSQLRYAERAA